MNKEILDQREILDKIDKEIANLLLQRLDCIKKIGNIKKENKLPIYDGDRESEIKEKMKMYSNSEEECCYLVKIYENIMDVSKREQMIKTRCDNNKP